LVCETRRNRPISARCSAQRIISFKHRLAPSHRHH
jgi:hypothetical protein